MLRDLEKEFQRLCDEEGRRGVLAAVPLSEIKLLPEQEEYLRYKLERAKLPREEISALSIGVAYHREEIEAIPLGWHASKPSNSRWDNYVRAYHQVNQILNRIASYLADSFGGVAERATMDGLAGQVSHVTQYFPHCVSHRAIAEAAGLGWRGKHGLIVTPEFGPAFRLASLFFFGRLESQMRELAGCGECVACLEVCPILRKGAREMDLNSYREACRRRIKALALDADVCGICVRQCWEAVANSGVGSCYAQ